MKKTLFRGESWQKRTEKRKKNILIYIYLNRQNDPIREVYRIHFMNIDIDIVANQKIYNVQGAGPLGPTILKRKPPHGGKKVELKVENVYRDEQSRWIVAVAESRDRKAFKQLFDYFAPRIKGFCQNNGSTADRADEVVQEAFVNVWRKASLFDPKKASAGAWIFAIARNSRIDLIRKENRPEADTTDPFFEQNEPESPLAVLEIERKSKILRSFVKGLPAEQQQVLRLAFFEEKAHSEVAEELGIPLGTVKSRIRLAFKRIRSELGEI